jgi:hypothetical protein
MKAVLRVVIDVPGDVAKGEMKEEVEATLKAVTFSLKGRRNLPPIRASKVRVQKVDID